MSTDESHPQCRHGHMCQEPSLYLEDGYSIARCTDQAGHVEAHSAKIWWSSDDEEKTT